MEEEAKRALAAMFQLHGQAPLTESEFVLEASHRLRWFSPKDAQRFLETSMSLGLLRVDGSRVRPAFDVSQVLVPVGFRPGFEVLSAPSVGADLFSTLLARIMESTGRDRSEVLMQADQVAERLDVDPDVALAVVARGLGVEIVDVLGELEAGVLRRAR